MLAFGLISIAGGANILAFFPFGGTSHHILFKPWITALCERGHKVTYLSPNQFNENVTNLEKIPYTDTWLKHIAATPVEWRNSYIPDSIFRTYAFLYDAMLRVGRDALETDAVKSILNSNRKYDVVITEAYFYNEWNSVVAHRFQATYIVFHTFVDYAWANEMSGLSDNPSYMMDHQFHKVETSGIVDRAYSAWTTFWTVVAGYFFTNTAQQDMIDELFRYPGWESRPRLSMLASDAALILRNTHHSIGQPVPAAPHVKDVGGLNIEFNVSKRTNVLKMKEYDDLRNFMDNAPNGFIYFSMGTQVKSWLLPKGTFEVIYSALSKLNVNVVMRWIDPDESPKTISPNIKLYYDFVPQVEILEHKNIKLFVTHGGLLSISEAVYFGVPILGIPVFGDQSMNVMKAEHHGFGLHLKDVTTRLLTEKEIVETSNELLTNPKYKKAAEKRSELFKDRIMTPLEEAIYWTEYVIKHGKILQPAAATMPFYQLYLLDVIAFTLMATITLVKMSKLAAKRIGELIANSNSKRIKSVIK